MNDIAINGSESMKAQLVKEIKKQTTKWIVSTVVILIVAALSGWWFYLKMKIPIIVSGVPSGAVMAFNLPKCPDGWSPRKDFVGRTIIGSGNLNDKSTIGLGAKGGNETVELTEAQLPKHSHTEAVNSCNGSGTEWGYLRGHTYDGCTPQNGNRFSERDKKQDII